MKSLLVLLPLALASCASTGPVMLQPARPAISPNEVRIYAEAPAQFESMALLGGSAGGSSRGEELIDEFRAQAAAIGANGVLLDRYDDRGWRARPGGYVGSYVGNRGSGTSLGLGVEVSPPHVNGEARAIWVE